MHAFGDEAKNRSVWGLIGVSPFNRRPYWDKRLEDEASDKQVSAQAAISCAVKAGVAESFSQFFGTEAEEDKKKKRKHHKIRASEAFGKFGAHATGPEFEAAAAAAEAAEAEEAEARATKRQKRADERERKRANDARDADAFYARMRDVDFDFGRFADGKKPGLVTVRVMKVVLVHKMGQNEKSVDDLKKRADVLQMFQQKLALLHSDEEA